MSPFMEKLVATRDDLKIKQDAIIATVDSDDERDSLTPEEDAEFRRLAIEIAEINERIVEIDEQERREAAAADALKRLGSAGTEDKTPQVTVGAEPVTYQRGGNHGYFRDLVARQLNTDPDASGRLARHAREVEVDAERRVRDGHAEYRDITRTDGAGGEFVPPLWLVDQYAAMVRAARQTADLVTSIPLPAGTDSVNFPRITTGASTAIQTADNAAVSETDLVTATVTAPVRTIAGQEDIAIQLIDQSPINFDEVVFADLAADYAAKLDVQVINGSGASGQCLGILGTSGIGAVTYTDASPTVPELYLPLAQSTNSVQVNRFLPATAFVMHPRRWNWMLSALDASSRPLVVPNQNGPFMAEGVLESVTLSGQVGSVLGLPVYVDPNVPINLGGGTNEDRVICGRFSDAILMESTPRTRVLPDVLSANLTVRLQLFNYVAFTAGRFPASFAAISGTGLVTPAGF